MDAKLSNNELRRYGECLSCGQSMDYLSNGHTAFYNCPADGQVDRWLKLVKKQWRVPESIWCGGEQIYVNGYTHRMQQYMCDDCNKRVNTVKFNFIPGIEPQACELEAFYQAGWNDDDWEYAFKILKGRKVALQKVREVLPKAVEMLGQDYFRKLNYDNFLKTPYWATLKKIVLDDRGHRCERCNASNYLHLHHVSYDHCGNEINHLEDVEVLCSTCHASHHGKPKK